MSQKAPTLLAYALGITGMAMISCAVNPTGANPLSLTHYLRYWHQQQKSTLSISLVTCDRLKPMANRLSQFNLTENFV